MGMIGNAGENRGGWGGEVEAGSTIGTCSP